MRASTRTTMRSAPAGDRASRPRQGAGYTLVELLIVIGILGLAGALLVPQLVGRDSMVAQAAVRRLISDLSFAQSDALTHQEYRRVQFFEDGTGYCLVRVTQGDFDAEFDADTADYIVDPLASAGSQGRYVVNFLTDARFRGVTITDVQVDGEGDFVTYDELGGTVMTGDAPGSGGWIILTDGASSYRLNIAPFTGKLTVQALS